MVYLVKFSKRKHLKLIQAWLKAHKHSEVDSSTFPKLGWIAYEKDTAVGCLFLRRVEGGFAQIDGIATNPEAESAARNEALDFLFDHAIKTAKSLNINGLIGSSRDKSMLMRSVKHGFAVLPLTLSAMNLK